MKELFKLWRAPGSQPVNCAFAESGVAAAVSPLLSDVEDNRFGPSDAPTFCIPLVPKHRLVALTDGNGVAAEQLRMLGTRLKYLGSRQAITKVLITSTIQNEGKSLVSANLAITLALQRHKTLLVDGDLHRPRLGDLFGVAGRRGLGDWWERKQGMSDFVCRAEAFPLWFLPAGKPVERPLTLLQSGELSAAFARISGWFDWV